MYNNLTKVRFISNYMVKTNSQRENHSDFPHTAVLPFTAHNR